MAYLILVALAAKSVGTCVRYACLVKDCYSQHSESRRVKIIIAAASFEPSGVTQALTAIQGMVSGSSSTANSRLWSWQGVLVSRMFAPPNVWYWLR